MDPTIGPIRKQDVCISNLSFNREEAGLNNEAVQTAACMMSASEPWKTFGYDKAKCIEKIQSGIDSGAKLLLACEEDLVVGFALFSLTSFSGSPELCLICVDSIKRSKGIGTNLLRHVEAQVFASEVNLFLRVTDFNSRGIKFYEERGYKQIGRIEDYNIQGSSELIYRKTLGPRLSR